MGGDFIFRSKDNRRNYNDYIEHYGIPGGLSEDQITGIALGIYMDFEVAYETYQRRGGTGLTGRGGAFAPEDLPSDYIGAWAFINGYALDDIPGILESLGNVNTYRSPLGEKGGSLVLNYSPIWGVTIPRNNEFTPMAPQSTYFGLGVKWENVPWPQELQIAPIESSNTTWWQVSP